jgi:acyl transferase domain-containing protein
VLELRQVSSRLSLDEVLEMARRVAGHVVDPDAPLLESAMDSLGAVELRNQLQAAVGTRQRLSTTLVFDHPTVRQIAKLLSPEVMEVARQVEIPAAVEGSRAASSRVALAGGSCEMPGMVHSDAALRCVLTSSLDTVSPFPSARDGGSGPEVSCGHLATWTLFDHTAFSISVQQATAMDPQQRLVLEHAYGAFHDANLRRSSLDGSLTGVVVGIWSIERYVAGLQDPSQSVYNATNTLSVCAGRVAYALGLHGAAIAIDAACAASLVACHIGVRAIEANESPTQLIAGVNILWTADAVAGAVRAGMGSPSFRCYTFDTRADGYARAEACVAAALQLDLSGKWPISVAGSAARQDGRSASLTAPNGLAQEALLRAVYARGIQFEHVSQIEAHGTGTCS